MRPVSTLCILSILAVLFIPTAHAQFPPPTQQPPIEEINAPLVDAIVDEASEAAFGVLSEALSHIQVPGVLEFRCVPTENGGMKCFGIFCFVDPVHRSLPVSLGGQTYIGVGVGPPDNKDFDSFGPYDGVFVSPSGTGCNGG